MIVNRLQWYLEKNALLNSNQSGFRKMHSTSDSIVQIKQEAEFAVKSGNHTIAIMIDFTKAFDLLWIDGLLAKMTNLGIKGNMIKWIKNYLENRINIVKIGIYLSKEYTSDNGTPQGSSLSPILFLIMLNDFPKLSQFTTDIFFADDCTIIRSGKNTKQIIYHLQKDLETIQSWCLEWGFTINIEKTTGILFTKHIVNLDTINLIISGKKIIFKTTCKLLGVIFDNHLTWKPHIDYIVDKTKKSLNVIRSISGTKWGAKKSILLTLYKSIILSIFDYCCFVYTEASLTNLQKLDTIQYKALLIVTGGIKGTSLNALLGECGELPLAYRRIQITTSYLMKLEGNQSNSAYQILKDKKYFQIDRVSKSKYKTIIDDYLKNNNIHINIKERLFNQNPWGQNNNNIDMTFLEQYPQHKTKDIHIQHEIINNILETEQNKYHHLLFIDGSVKSEGKVGVAIYSNSLNLQIPIKLPDNLSIYYAEAYALSYSLKLIIRLNIVKFCIISDCATVLNHIKQSEVQTSPHPYLIQDICKSLLILNHCDFIIKWMPGHSNYPGSNTVDKLAKLATTLNNPISIEYTNHEAILAIDPWVCSLWMKKWKEKPKGRYQTIFSPTMKCINIPNVSRKKETIISRLRMLQTKLNEGLKKIGKSQTADCDVCGEIESCEHFLLHCSKTEELRRRIQTILQTNQATWTYQNIMNNQKILDSIASYVIEKGIIV